MNYLAFFYIFSREGAWIIINS